MKNFDQRMPSQEREKPRPRTGGDAPGSGDDEK